MSVTNIVTDVYQNHGKSFSVSHFLVIYIFQKILYTSILDDLEKVI